jgi:hypothetical protein
MVSMTSTPSVRKLHSTASRRTVVLCAFVSLLAFASSLVFGLKPAEAVTSGTRDYCKTLEAVRRADRDLRKANAFEKKDIPRYKRLFRRLAGSAPSRIKSDAELLARYSNRFLDAAGTDHPKRAVENLEKTYTPAFLRDLERAAAALDKFSRQDCGFTFSV